MSHPNEALLRAKYDGRRFEEVGVHVFELRDGKIAEAWFHDEDQAAYDAFWS